MTSDLIVQMRNIHVNYGTTQVLKGVDFDLRKGEIHGLVGEHRSGKSTLVKVLSGAVRMKKGLIYYRGVDMPYFTPHTAMRDGISMFYQHNNVINALDAVENMYAGYFKRYWWGGVRRRVMEKEAQQLLDSLGIDLDLNIPLSLMPQADQHMVELAKVLINHPEVIIFDEISFKLTPVEMERVYKLLFGLRHQGRSVIYITHNMNEIFDLADRVTIMQNGRNIGTEEIQDIDKVKLIKLTYSFVMSREELEHHNRELFLLKKYNEDIIKNIPEGIVILDEKNHVYLTNYAASAILEIDQDRIMNLTMDAIVPKDADGEITEQAAELMKAIDERTEKSWDEFKHGDNKYLRIHIGPFKDENDRYLGTIIIFEDITRDRQVNEYLLRSQKIESIAELAAGVAHEINNPLGIISNYVAIMRRKMQDEDSLRKLEKVDAELKRIAGIVESLLSFSKINRIPVMRRVAVQPLIDDILILLNHKLRQKNINIIRDPGEAIFIAGQENKLKQVLMNLIVNSWDAVPEGGTIRIAATCPNDGQYAEITVTDNGSGIPPEVMDKIFDPFFSTKVGKTNTGLGLSICQHIIESHDGLMSCTSKSGKTTFSIRLPLKTPE
ncbi:MAG: ATP-binding cassette domain-containing protein [Spartobacteria bacterium]|nr:ATP-binding cassette domain-containing protein [Spartobacteria bacterium]